MITTRIKKYANLRSKIEQEIKVLQLKVKNDAKLHYYSNQVKKIAPDFFSQAQEEMLKSFPDLKSLITTTTTIKKNDLKEEKTNIIKELEWLEEIALPKKSKGTKISDYVPNLDNEELLLTTLDQWKKNQFYQKQDFVKMLNLKKKINANQEKIPKADLNKINIFTTANKINNQIQNHHYQLQKLIREKKSQTKWLLFLGLFFFFGLTLCLILFFLFF